MAHFERREWEENTWHPEIAGVDFTERLYKFMGDVALDGTQIYTAWLVTEDQEIQITPESSRAFISLVDDESDTITVLDPSDGLWFHFMRVTHSDNFQEVFDIVAPWAAVTTGVTPTEEVYAKYLEIVSQDTAGDFLPDGWE